MQHPSPSAPPAPARTPHRLDDPPFSPFQTPPSSEQEHPQSGDEDPQAARSSSHPEGQHSSSRQRSHPLVEQLPLQGERRVVRGVGPGMDGKGEGAKGEWRAQDCEKKTGPARERLRQGGPAKENCGVRFNYMERIERQLSTIREEGREDTLGSARRIRPLPSCPQQIYCEDSLAVVEQQRMAILLLEQQNIALRERVLGLERELLGRGERTRREEEREAQGLLSARQEAKGRLLEEVGALQARCKEMREEMRVYKQRQEESLRRLLLEREEKRDYQGKFAEVFLKMVEKLPVELGAEWSEKRRIAVGWKVVKHFVKKALRLGIPPPRLN